MNTIQTFFEQLTLRQKIELILNTNLWTDTPINQTTSNIFEQLEDYSTIDFDVRVLRALADSWNLELVKQYANLKALTQGNDYKIVVLPFGVIDVEGTNIYGVDQMTDDLEYLKLLLTTYVNALKENNFVVIGRVEQTQESSLEEATILLITQLGLDAVVFNGEVPTINDPIEPLLFERHSYGRHVTYALKTTISAIEHDHLQQSLTSYEEYETNLANELITEDEFNHLVNENIVFNIEDIDECVTKIKLFTEKVFIERSEEASIDQEASPQALVETFFKQLAHESSVFYKREKDILEDLTQKRVVLVSDELGEEVTRKDIAQYFPACMGIYDEEDINHIVTKPDGVIFIINPFKDVENNFNQQLETIRNLFHKGLKIVAVVPSEMTHLPADWTTYSSVIIKADLFDIASFYGLLEILSLKVHATGRLTKGIQIDKMSADGASVNPFYSLNPSRFVYKRVTAKLPTVDLTVTNPDAFHNVDVIKIYLSDASNGNTGKVFVGLKKIRLEGKETQTISIPVDQNILESNPDQLHSNVSIELRSFHGVFTFTTKNSKKEKKTNKVSKKPKGSNKLKTKLIRLLLLLLYFNVPLLIALNAVIHEYYKTFIGLVMIVVNYLIIKVVFQPSQPTKQKADYNDLLSVMDDIDYLDAKEEVVFDQDQDVLNQYQMDEEQDFHVVINESNLTSAGQPFDDDFHLGEYLQKLSSDMANNGIKCDTRVYRELLSSIVASRLLIAKVNDDSVTIPFLRSFVSIIGSSLYFETISSNNVTFNTLLTNENSGFYKCYSSALELPETMHFMVFKGVDLSLAHRGFSELLNYLDDPYKWLNEHDIYIPENIWFIFIPEDTQPISNQLLKRAFTVDIDGELVEPKDSSKPSTLPFRYDAFFDHYQDSKEQFFLDEDLWKKIDQVEEYIAKHYHVTFDNPFVRQLESYQSVYLMGDGEPYEMIDSLFSQKILPFIFNQSTTPIDPDEESLLDLCDRLIGLDHLNKSRQMLATLNHITRD